MRSLLKTNVTVSLYYTLDCASTNKREPYLGILFRKDGKYYLNSSALRDEVINNTDVEIEKEKWNFVETKHCNVF